MTIDITQQLNYSQAVRRARPEWDDDKVRRAAEYLVLYMDVRLKPCLLYTSDAAEVHESMNPAICDV